MSKEFEHYEVLCEIGRGGMGVVYQALDRANQRMVAIKQLLLENVDPAKKQEFLDRFRREAATAARLSHQNIVSVFDVGQGAENNFYVMEFLEGHSLRRELERRGGKFEPADFLVILKQVADGLDYAHSLNLVHRDVKPDNIFLLRDGRVKLTDFGIARTVDYEQTHLTKTGVMLGTLAYVSPEQLQDAKAVDHRADIFSLGVVSYEALSGRLPFTGEGIAQTVIRILSSEPESLHMFAGGVSVETAAVVAKSLRKKARDRYTSVLDFARDFERSLSQKRGIALESGSMAIAATDSLLEVNNKWTARIYTPGVPIGEIVSNAPKESSSSSLSSSSSSTNTFAGGFNTGALTSGSTSFYLARPIAAIGRKGEGDGMFLEPAVICARAGKIVVADTVTRKIQLFARDGRWLKSVVPQHGAKSSQTAGGSMTTPSGIAIDYRGRIYASDSNDHYIRVFDSQGNYLKEFVNIHGKDGGIQGLACDSAGLIYASDADNGCLQVFQSELGSWLRKVGIKGTKEGQIQMPAGVALDRLNQVYVVDYGASRISVFSKAGTFIRCFGGRGTANGLFNVPRGIAIDKHDRIYVSDSLNHRIQIFGPSGDWLHSFGGRGSELGKFAGPSGVSVDSENNCLYVADRGNHRVQVFELCAS